MTSEHARETVTNIDQSTVRKHGAFFEISENSKKYQITLPLLGIR